MMDFLSHITSSVTSLLMWLGGIAAVVFLLISYFSGNNLKSQFEKMGLKKPETNAKEDEKQDSKKGEGDKKEQTVLEQIISILNTGYEVTSKYIRKGMASIGLVVNGPIADSFRNATAELKERLGVEEYQYHLPWFLVVGDTESGKTTVLENIPLSHPIVSPNFQDSKDPAIAWWFYEKAIVLDIKASTLYGDNADLQYKDWKSLLNCLTRYRPNHPLDGLVLALPANYFIGPDKLSEEELRKRASRLSEKLVQAENKLGLKLPIYILLTKAEKIAGFQGFANEVSEDSLSEMIGWSNPYSTDISYLPKHVNEAIDYISSSLFQTAITLFARGHIKEYADDAMLFPQSFESLKEGIQVYLDTLFNFTDYQDHFIWRGLYLTGNKNADEGQTFDINQDETLLKIPSKPKLVFLKDLFSKKIFKEVGVAKPIKHFLSSTNKKITYLKTTLISLLGLGICSLYLGYKDVSNKVNIITPILERTAQAIEVKLSNNISEEAELQYYKTTAAAIIDLFMASGSETLISTYLPASWIGMLERKFENTVAQIYNRYLAASIYRTFNIKASYIMRAPLPTVTTLAMPSNPTSTPEFLVLHGYVQELAQLESAIKLYDDLCHNNFNASDDPEKVQKIVRYLFNINVPDNVVQNPSQLVNNVLAQANYRSFNMHNYSLLAERRLYDLYNAFLRRVLDPKYNYALAAQLQQALGKVETRDVPDIEKFRLTLKSVKELNAFITNASTGEWLSQAQFNPGSQYQLMMQMVKQLKILNPSVPAKLSNVSALIYEKAKKYLQSYGSPLTGYFFTEDPDTKKLIPSPGLITLEKGLDAFLQKPFMFKTDGTTFISKRPQGKLIHWDTQLIRDALALVEEYKKFLQEELPTYPADLQDTLKTIGRKQTAHNVNAILGRAQAFYDRPNQYWTQEGEDSARAQTDNLNETGPLFVKLLEALNSINDVTTYTSLRDLLFEQMYRNLAELDKVLENADYFKPGSEDMSWWQGDKNLMYKAFNVADKQEMLAYLGNQFKRVSFLIEEQASPLVAFLKSEAFQINIKQVKLIERWARMLEQIAAYKKDNAASSPKILEKFIVDEGNDINFENCFDKIPSTEANASTGDYFLGKRNQLRKQIYTQCNVILADKAAVQYKQVADLFNSYMANVYPFSNDIPNTSPIEDEVSDGILTEFFKEFDKLTPSMRDAIKNIGTYNTSWPKVAAFLNSMAEIRSFLDDYFAPKKKDGEPGVTFDVSFRENKGREREGDKVLTWAVVAGDQSVDSQSANRTLRWRLGDNFSIGFQWAQNTPLFPVRDTGDPALSPPIANTSLFVYQGFWSLLRALQLHQPPIQEGGSTADDTLIKFTIPLGPDPNGAASTNAELFLKIIPRNARGLKGISFKIPKFPTEAPQLQKAKL